MRGFKKQRGSREDSLEDLFDDGDMMMSAPEEPPYFPEKWYVVYLLYFYWARIYFCHIQMYVFVLGKNFDLQ